MPAGSLPSHKKCTGQEGVGWSVITSMILEYVRDGVGCNYVNDLSMSGMGWGVITSMMLLEYVRDGVMCDNANDTRVRCGS